MSLFNFKTSKDTNLLAPLPESPPADLTKFERPADFVYYVQTDELPVNFDTEHLVSKLDKDVVNVVVHFKKAHVEELSLDNLRDEFNAALSEVNTLYRVIKNDRWVETRECRTLENNDWVTTTTEFTQYELIMQKMTELEIVAKGY